MKIHQSSVHVLQAYRAIAQELNAHANVLAKLELHPGNLADEFTANALQPVNSLKRKLPEGEGPMTQIRSLLSEEMEPGEALQEAYELLCPWATQIAPAMPECVRNMMYT